MELPGPITLVLGLGCTHATSVRLDQTILRSFFWTFYHSEDSFGEQCLDGGVFLLLGCLWF